MSSPSADRLLLATLIALLVHAGAILGIRFKLVALPKIEPVLDIELIEQEEVERPRKPDYRAPIDSVGKAMREKPVPKLSPKPQVQSTSPKAQEKRASFPQARIAQAQIAKESEAGHDVPHLDRSLLARQIAELAPAHAIGFGTSERVMPIGKVSAYKHIAAAYERAWQDKVERVGNLNYPDEARRQKLSGAVLVSVWVAKDGQVKKIQLHRSSGYPVLDEAVTRIVRLASPFAPFPVELAKQADEIVITRTWKFYDEAGLAMGN